MFSPFLTKLLNIVLYQVGWFCCVLGGAWGYPVSGGVLALLLVGVHLLLASSRKTEALLMVTACLLGVMVDSTQQALGLFAFKTEPGWPLWLPLWVFVIWAQFATLLHYALAWLQGRYLMAALLGSIGGPLAYYGGGRFGAATFPSDLLPSLLILGGCWAVVTPLLMVLARRFSPQPLQARYRFTTNR